MPARVECIDGEIRMRVVGRGDHHECDLGIGQGFIEVGIAPDAFAPEGQRLFADRRIAGDDPVQDQSRLPTDQWAVKCPARQAMSDDDGRNHVRSPGGQARAPAMPYREATS